MITVECFYARCPGQTLVSAGKIDMEINEYVSFIKGRNATNGLTTEIIVNASEIVVNSKNYTITKFSDRISCPTTEINKLLKLRNTVP